MAATSAQRRHLARQLGQYRTFLAIGMAIPGGVCVVLLLALVCANVGARAFDIPFRGAVESSGILGALIAASALGYAQIHRNHITGGVAVGRLPRTLRRLLQSTSTLVGVVFFLMAGWELYDFALFALESGETQELVGSLYPWLIMAAVPGFVVQSAILAITFCIGLLTGEE